MTEPFDHIAAVQAPVAPGPFAAYAPTPTIPAHILVHLTNERLPHTPDGVLMAWQRSQAAVEAAKGFEMELRKLNVALFVPKPREGMNNVDLGNGYTLKAGVKFNYNLKPPVGKDIVDAVDDVIDRFARLDNEGSFIADRLFSWKVDLSVAEYRKLYDEAQTSATKAALLRELNTILEIKDAAPTLEIKEPKVKK